MELLDRRYNTKVFQRVEELFEARKPKGLAIVSEISGTIKIDETKKKRTVIVVGENQELSYDIPFGSRLKVSNGDVISAGDEITEGSVNPHDVLRIKGPNGVKITYYQKFKKFIGLQGVDINDKHLEVVVRQMTRKVKIEDSGDTEFLPGTMVDIFDFQQENAKVQEEGEKSQLKRRITLLGITKSSISNRLILIICIIPRNY